MYKLQWIVLFSYFLYLNVQSRGNLANEKKTLTEIFVFRNSSDR